MNSNSLCVLTKLQLFQAIDATGEKNISGLSLVTYNLGPQYPELHSKLRDRDFHFKFV